MEQQLELNLEQEEIRAASRPSILVDLDRTLAHEVDHHGPETIGAPVPLMVERVREALRAGHGVEIFTARVGPHDDEQWAVRARAAVQKWCIEHLGVELPITATKAWWHRVIWDDRADGVIENTGKLQSERIEELEAEVVNLKGQVAEWERWRKEEFGI